MRKGKNIKGKLLGLVIAALLVFLIFTVLIPPATAVHVGPGVPNPTSVTKPSSTTFENVNLTIRSNEKIYVNFLNFTIHDNDNDDIVAYINFSLGGTSNDASDGFSDTSVDLTTLYNSNWLDTGYGYGYDERAGGIYGRDGYGYGYGGSEDYDITFLFNITYGIGSGHSTGDFYGKLTVNSTYDGGDHDYVSEKSTLFNVGGRSSRSSGGSATSNNAPTADASGPYIGVIGEPITFDGTGSTDPDGDILTYSWEFGDGATGTGLNPDHIYDSAGTYEVNLTVSDGSLTNTSSITATISESDIDSDGDGYKDDMEESYGTNANDDSDFPTDTDGDGIPDDDSPDGKYTGDTDDDNDGLDDETEEELGSNPKDGTDVTTITIGENSYHLVDTDGDGEFDTIYNSQSKEAEGITVEDGKISIDVDGDGEADFLYDISSGGVKEYSEKTETEEFPLWLAILAIIIVIVVIILALIKTGYLYIEGEEPGKKK